MGFYSIDRFATAPMLGRLWADAAVGVERSALARMGCIGLCWNGMHIDAKGTVGEYPALVVRTALRRLRQRLQWKLPDLEAAAGLAAGRGRSLVKALRAEGLIDVAGRGAWTLTQAGMTLSAASAAKPVTRATAERVFAHFLERVAQVNRDPYYLAKVVRVVLFGSMLKPEVDRLSDVDVAFELARKEADPRRALVQSRQRAEELEDQGRRFRSILEREFCWQVEAYDFLKGRSRVLALAEYSTEWPFVLAVPHRFLIGEPEQIAVEPAPSTAQEMARKRRRRPGCPF